MYSTDSDPSNQIPWFATSLGHIDLQTSRDWREDTSKTEEKAQGEQKTSASSVKGRKSSTSAQRIGIGGLPPLVEKKRSPPVPTISEKIISRDLMTQEAKSYITEPLPEKIDHSNDKVNFIEFAICRLRLLIQKIF